MNEQVLRARYRRPALAGRRAAVIGAVVNDAGCPVRAVATRLVAEGAAVALLDRDTDTAAVVAKELTADGGQVGAFALDLRDDGQVSTVIGETEAFLDGIDLVVHLAGAPHTARTSVDQFAAAPWARALGAGLGASVVLVRHVVPALRRAGRGAFVLVGPADSGASMPEAVRMAGLHGLAVTLDRHLRPEGVRVVEVTVPAAMLDPADPDPDTATVARAAATVSFLASDEGEPVTGTVRVR
jgi:NAD(P)-dependent dehydrogenase (short-subunit alcohol dehydrogenase family)